MKATKTKIASGTISVARRAATMVGLAVIVAVAIGGASMAFAANGKPFVLGGNNAASALTTLAKSGSGPALRLLARPGNPPMAVNTKVRVANLNADKLDGEDASRFARAGTPAMFAAGQIRPDGSIRNSVGAVSDATHPTTGIYCVAFSQPAGDPGRLESAVVGLAGGQFEGRNFPRVVNGTGIAADCASDTLVIQVTDAAGNPEDGRFSFVIP